MLKINTNKNLIEIDTKLFDAILDSVGAYIYIKDTNRKYVFANQLALDLFGQTAESFVGMADDDLFDAELIDALKENDRRVIELGETIESEETLEVSRLHEVRTYLAVKKPIYNNQLEIIGLYGVSTDITGQKELQKEMSKQKKFLDLILNNIDAHIYMKDSKHRFLYVNKFAADSMGVKPDDVVGKLDTDLIPIEIAKPLRVMDDQVFKNNVKIVGNESFKDSSGALRHYLTTKLPLSSDNDTSRLLGVSTDVTELFLLKEKLEKQATLDDLTGLHNRRYFFELANSEFSRCKRHSQSMAMIYIDVDHFKSINDNYGHPVGDIVLTAIGKNLKALIRQEDAVGRLGGEEFVVLVTNNSIEMVSALAERIRNYQETQKITGDWQGVITPKVSIGLSSLKDSDRSIDDLIARADKALYQSKSNGRNQVSWER